MHRQGSPSRCYQGSRRAQGWPGRTAVSLSLLRGQRKGGKRWVSGESGVTLNLFATADSVSHKTFHFRYWNCPCVPMRERHECHCMLFLTEDNDFAGEETVSTDIMKYMCFLLGSMMHHNSTELYYPFHFFCLYLLEHYIRGSHRKVVRDVIVVQ